MDREDIKLDQMFAAARDQAAETSFEETKKQFLKSMVLAAGGVLATKGILHLLTKKTIVMISLITTVTTTTAVVVSSVYNNPENEYNEAPNHEVNPVVVENEQAPKEIVENNATKQFIISETTEVSAKTEDIKAIDLTEIEKIKTLDPFHVYIEHPADTNYNDKTQQEPKVSFVITSSTTENELKEIKAAAESAGIDLTYDYKIKNGKLSYVAVTMNLTSKEGKQKIVTTTDFEGNDKMKINWTTDKEGNALSISAGDLKREYAKKTEKEETPEHPHGHEAEENDQETLREFMKEIKRDLKEVGQDLKKIDEVELPRLKKLREKIKDLDSLSQPVKAEIEEQIEKIEQELKRIREKLKEIDDEEEKEKNEERKKELEEIEEDLEEVIEDMEEELEDLEEELEDIKKENEEQNEKE